MNLPKGLPWPCVLRSEFSVLYLPMAMSMPAMYTMTHQGKTTRVRMMSARAVCFLLRYEIVTIKDSRTMPANAEYPISPCAVMAGLLEPIIINIVEHASSVTPDMRKKIP